MLDEPTMSDQTLLLSVEDLINLAMGPIAGNTVDFKMLKTILHILARQMRLLEQKVVLEVGELPAPPLLRLPRRDQEGSQSTSTESKGKDAAGSKKKRKFDDIQEDKRDSSLFGDKGEESESSVDSYEMEERREEAQRARDKDIAKVVKAERDKERAEAERAKMEKMDPAEREEYQKQLQKEKEQREKAEKLAAEEEEKAEKEAKAQREMVKAEREKLKAEKSRLRLEKEKETAEKEREIAEREGAKMGEMSPSEQKEYQKQLEKEKEERKKALRMAQDEEERVEKEKARAEKDKARAEKEKERAERERAKMENMSPREKESYQQELDKVKAEREQESRKLEKMDSKEREEYEKAQHKERERVKFENMTPSEKELYEQELQKKKDEKEKEKLEKMSPEEREQYMEEKEKLKKLGKMSPKERENYEKEKQKEIAEKEQAKLDKMSPKEREKYQKEQEKEKAEKEKAKLEKMSPKEREKYEKQQQKEKERAEKEQAKIEKMSPKEREKYEKEKDKEKEKAEKDSDKSEKEKAKLERMSPKEREKYEKEQQREKEKAEKEKAKIEKMSPKEREKYEKEQEKEKAQKEKEKMERMSPKEREKYEKEQQKEKEKAEKEKARIEKMSPKEREKYEKEQQKGKEKGDKDSEKSEKEKAKLEKMSPKEREKYEKEQQKEKEKAEKRAQKELEKEKAKMEKMSPEEREKYLKEKEKAEREARDKARADESAKLNEVVESITEKYDTKLKEKVLVVEKGSSGRGSEPRSRRSSIEVVTRSQFALLEAAVEALRENTSPLPALTLPDNDQLRTDLAKGNVSLTDAMMAMQVSARVQAAEQAIGRLGGVLTQLAGQGGGPEGGGAAAEGGGAAAGGGHAGGGGGHADGDEHGPEASRSDGTRAHGRATPSMTSQKSVHLKEPGMDLASRPSRMSTATGMGLSRASVIPKGPSSMALTQYEMDAALDALRKELMDKVNAITSRALTSAETTSNLAKSVVDKMDVAMKIDDRISTLNALVGDYTEQLAGFDAGLTTQMQSFREQITQMRGDLSSGLALLESANNNAETAAMLELTERYEELVNGLDNTLLAHQALAAFQDQLNLDFRSLLESVEMLREQKADRDEVIDGLRDKADNERLAGLLREDDFNEARSELDHQLALCHEKFRKQDAVWVAALKELTGVVQRKAEHTDLMKTRQETTQQLQEIDEKIKRLAFILGEPKAAILTRRMAKDALCAVCLVPALMDPEDSSTGKPPRLPAVLPGRALGQRAATAVAEEPCVQEWKPPEAPDLRTHTCLRWVGGSHTLLSAVKRGHCEQPLVPPTTTRKFLGQGDDGKLYAMEDELEPCEECNQPLHCTEGGPCINYPE